MSYLVPKSFWSNSFFNAPSLIDDDADWGLMTNSPSGLSLSEDDKNVFVEVSVPGVDAENIDVTFERGVLHIVAENKTQEKEGRKVVRRSQSHFSYQVVLPESVDVSGEPEAHLEKGVMKLTFPKSAKSQPKKITVTSK